jgi:hypothetical protein
LAALREVVAAFGIEFDSKQLEKGDGLVDSMVDKLAGFGKIVAGAFAIGAVANFTSALFAEADALAKQAGALGVSTEELQGWQHAAKLSGSSAEEFTAALTKFTRNVDMAAKGTGPAAEAFKKLGIDIKSATEGGAAPIDLLDSVADSLAGIQDPAKRTSAVMDLFGKSGARLLPLFDQGAEGIAKLRAEVKELGANFDEAFLENAQAFNDNVDRMKLGLKGLAIQAIGPLLPDLVRMTQQIVATTKTFVGWIRQSEIVRALILGISGKGLVGLISKFGGLAKALAPLRALLLKTFLPLLILEDFLTFLAGGDSVIGDLIDKAFGTGKAAEIQSFFAGVQAGWDEMLGTAKNNTEEFDRTWTAALNDMRRSLNDTFGPFLTEVVVAAEDTFFAFVKALSGGWDGFSNFAIGLLQGLLFMFKLAWDDITFAALITVATIQDKFAEMWNSIAGGAEKAVQAIGKVLANIPGLGDFGKSLQNREARTLEGGNVNVVKSLQGQVNKERLAEAEAIAAKLGLAGATATAPVGGPSQTNIQQTNQPNITINVPPGTDADMARRVGGAANNGMKQAIDLRGTKAALAPTAG